MPTYLEQLMAGVRPTGTAVGSAGGGGAGGAASFDFFGPWSTQGDRNTGAGIYQQGQQNTWQGGQNQADRNLQTSLQGSQFAFQGGQNNLDRVLQQMLAQGGWGNALALQGLQNQGAQGTAGINAGASMYGADQNRIADMFGSQTALSAALAQAGASRYGADQSLAASQYGSAQAAGASRYGADQQRQSANLATQSQLQAALARNQIDQMIAQLSNQTQRYGIDQQFNLGQLQDKTNRYGIDQQLQGQLAGYGSAERIASGDQATQRYGADQQFRLGDLTSGRELQGQLAGYGSNERIADLTSGRQLEGTRLSSLNDLLGRQYTADRGLEGTQFSSTADLLGNLGVAGMNNATQRYGIDTSLLNDREGRALRQGNFNQIASLLGEQGSQGGAREIQVPELQPFSGSGGGDVFTPEQIAAKQNDLRARAIQQAQTAQQRTGDIYGSRGVGEGAALQQMMQNLEMLGRMSGDQGALDFDLESATANARNRNDVRALEQQSHQNYMANLLQRYAGQIGEQDSIRGAGANRFGSILGALSSLGA